jgi:hypothetical protein
MRVLRLFNFFGLNGLVRAALNRQVKALELSQVYKPAADEPALTSSIDALTAHKSTK